MHLGLIGYGNIARGVLDALRAPDATPVDRVTVLVRPGSVGGLEGGADAVDSLEDFLRAAPGLVVECAGQGAVRDFVPAILRAGIDVIAASVGALAEEGLLDELRDAAEQGRAKLILPPGAVGGVDILSALQTGDALSLRYRGSKPPAAWTGTPAADRLDLAALDHAEVFYSGDARGAALQYPKNANVAATLALAGAGFEATSVELSADPDAPGNVHEFTIEADAARVSVRIENRPSAGNAKTSQVTIYSLLRAIRNHTGPLVI